MKKISIIGAGFAALTAIKHCRKLNPDAQITLISPYNEFIYMPSLIWIPCGIRKSDDLRVPLDNYLKKMRVKLHQAAATGMKNQGRTILTDKGDVENDGLIICSGGRFIKKLPGIEHSITPCEGIPAAERIRDRLSSMEGGTIAIGFAGNPKEPSAMRGGPMFEFLFGLDTQLRKEKRRDKFNLVFFTPAPQPGNRLGPKAVKGLLDEMKKRGIETHLGNKLKGFTETSVKMEAGEFNADLILFMPGMTGNQWFDKTDLVRSEGGLVKANQHCQAEGLEKVYVAGDSGSYPGPDWMPKQAHMADLQAEAAAKNLTEEFNQKTPNHTFKIELVCIVDSQTHGMMISRTPSRSIMLPNLRLMHWAKRIFEWWYLRGYR